MAAAVWAVAGLAVTVALAYGVGLTVAALRHAATRRRSARSGSFVRPDGRLVLADLEPAPRRRRDPRAQSPRSDYETHA